MHLHISKQQLETIVRALDWVGEKELSEHLDRARIAYITGKRAAHGR